MMIPHCRKRSQLVALKRRIDGSSDLFDTAIAVFFDFQFDENIDERQLFGAFIVRDGRLVATCGPRTLEHLMHWPTSIGDGQTLLGGVESESGRCYECLLDVESGEQRVLKVDSMGRPVESDMLFWVRSSEQIASELLLICF